MAPASFSMIPSGSEAVAGAACAATCVHSSTILRCKRAQLRFKVLSHTAGASRSARACPVYKAVCIQIWVLQLAEGRSHALALSPVGGREHCAEPSQPAPAAVKPQAARVLAWYQTGVWSCSVLGFGERGLGLRALRLRPHASISVSADSRKTEIGLTN